jgi:hypothetical protein
MKRTIEKWKLNKSLLAAKMNMTVTTFCNKLNGKDKNHFDKAETIRLKMVLKELYNDLDGIIDIDFNDALKMSIIKEK